MPPAISPFANRAINQKLVPTRKWYSSIDVGNFSSGFKSRFSAFLGVLFFSALFSDENGRSENEFYLSEQPLRWQFLLRFALSAVSQSAAGRAVYVQFFISALRQIIYCSSPCQNIDKQPVSERARALPANFSAAGNCSANDVSRALLIFGLKQMSASYLVQMNCDNFCCAEIQQRGKIT